MTGSKFEYYLKAIKILEELSGISFIQAQRILGYEYGKGLAQRIKSNSPIEILKELSELLKKSEIGETILEEGEPIRLIVTRCLACEWIPDIELTESRCPLREGLIEAVLREKTGLNVEVKSHSEGSEYGSKICEFKIFFKRKPL